MSYPKQPGQDGEAHRELASRNLVLLQENASLRSELDRKSRALLAALEVVEAAVSADDVIDAHRNTCPRGWNECNPSEFAEALNRRIAEKFDRAIAEIGEGA